jgi:hypothetical protein
MSSNRLTAKDKLFISFSIKNKEMIRKLIIIPILILKLSNEK